MKVYVLKGLVIGTDFERADIEGVFKTLEGAKKGLLEMIDIIKSNENDTVEDEEIFDTSAILDTEYGTHYEYNIIEQEVEE